LQIEMGLLQSLLWHCRLPFAVPVLRCLFKFFILSQFFVFQYNSNNFSLKLKFSTKKEVPQPTPLVGFYPIFYFGML